MTVKELKEALANVPDDAEVRIDVDCKCKCYTHLLCRILRKVQRIYNTLIMKYIYIILYAIVSPIFWVANCFAQLMTKAWI